MKPRRAVYPGRKHTHMRLLSEHEIENIVTVTLLVIFVVTFALIVTSPGFIDASQLLISEEL